MKTLLQLFKNSLFANFFTRQSFFNLNNSRMSFEDKSMEDHTIKTYTGQIGKLFSYLLLTILTLGLLAGFAPQVYAVFSPGLQLRQCEDSAKSDSDGPCIAPNNGANPWTGGNIKMFEDDFVPYRLRMINLNEGEVYTLTLLYDATKAGDHAIDYLGDYDATANHPDGIDPCTDILGASNCANPA